MFCIPVLIFCPNSPIAYSPISYAANPSLGAWAFSQKMAYKKDKLSDEKCEKLLELGFKFAPKKQSPEKEEEV